MFFKFHKIFDALTALERQVFEGALMVFAVSLFLNGANVFYRETVLTPIGGGVYVEGLVGQPIAVNPILISSNDADRDLSEIAYMDLLELAENQRSNGDNREWTVLIKENLYWSDGEPLSADDVIFTIETIQNPETLSPLANAWQSVSVEKLGDREVRFILKTPYAFFEENLADLKIIPRHIFGTIPAANLRLSDYNLEPVGSGPYRFSSFKKRKDGFILEYRFAANENYSGDKPLIEEFVFKFFPTYEAAIDAFNRHEINGLGGMLPERLGAVKVGYRVHEIKIPRYYAVFLNQSTSPALRDKPVRTALALSAPRERIIKQSLSGRGIAVDGPLYPENEGYIPAKGGPEKNAAETAREIIEKSGWEKNAEGVFEKKIDKENIELKFELVVPEIDFLVSAARALESSWKEIGVGIKLDILKPVSVANEAIRTRNYNMILFGNILKNSSDVFSFWHSSERFYPGLNLSLYENKKVDELLESIRRNSDQSARAEDLEMLQELIREDAPAVFLFSPNYLYLSTKDLGGFTSSRQIAAPANRLDGAEYWYLKTARIFR